MSVKITNTSPVQRLVRLNSGRTRRLAPGESVEVEPLEVKNRGVKRLVGRRAISAEDSGGGRDGHRRSREMSAADAADFIVDADESELERGSGLPIGLDSRVRMGAGMGTPPGSGLGPS